MRVLFLLVLLANLLFFVLYQGYFGKIIPDNREPERITLQVQPEKVHLLTAQEFTVQTMLSPDGLHQLPPETLLAILRDKACVQFGGFAGDDQQRIENWLTPLNLDEQVALLKVDEQVNWSVLIPPLKSRADADKKAQELRNLGINDFFIISDESEFRFAISLGVFKNEESAKAYLAKLNRKGVRSAKVTLRAVILNKLYLQFLKPDTALLEKLIAIKSSYPNQELRECPVIGSVIPK